MGSTVVERSFPGCARKNGMSLSSCIFAPNMFQKAEGTAQSCMVSDALRRIDGNETADKITIIKESVATAFGGEYRLDTVPE
jgi:hypothetical protein